jgi:hypothetical protein
MAGNYTLTCVLPPANVYLGNLMRLAQERGIRTNDKRIILLGLNIPPFCEKIPKIHAKAKSDNLIALARM